MKVFYASAITFPSLPVNRLQTLNTAEALRKELGDAFELGACLVEKNNLYAGRLKNFGHHRSIVLGWKEMQYVKRNRFDVVYGREWTLVWSMMMFNRFFFRYPVRFIFELHDIPEDFRIPLIMKKSEHVFCISHGIINDLKKQYPDTKTSLLRNGVNLKTEASAPVSELKKKFGLPLDTKIVTYIGSVGRYSWKGEDVLLNARQYTKHDPVHYVVAGLKNDEVDSFGEVWGTDRTTVLGRLDAQEVADIQALSDIVVLPNKPINIMAERYTCPIKMFEYMRSGTPIVASNLPSIREVLDERMATFFEPGDSEALAAAIQEVLKDTEAAKKKAMVAKEEVSQYSWEEKAKKIITYLTRQ